MEGYLKVQSSVMLSKAEEAAAVAGAFHGVTEADAIINVGVSGPGVVKTVSYTHLDVYKRQWYS